MAVPVLPILTAVLPPVINMVKNAFAKPKDRLDKDAFLKLLMAQLRNQNPLNPLSNDQFITQSTAFSNLEALHAIQSTLEASQGGTSRLTGVADLLGKKVTGLTGTFAFAGRPVELPYTLPSDAGVVVEVSDGNGTVVKRFNLGRQSAGPHLVAFNGQGDGSLPLPVGNYRYRVLAATGGGQLEPLAAITGLVSGIALQQGVPMISLGSVQMAVSDLTAVSTLN
jgi:flagellar basal-body rod modification protein FlgD